MAPKLITATLASLTGFGLARRHASKLAYVLGLSLGLVASGLLLASSQVERDHLLAYPLLLAASAFIGAGFGLTVPVLLAYSRFLHACAEDVSVLGINALIALGAVIAPGVAMVFVNMHRWLGLPALSAALLVALLLCSKRLPQHVGAPQRPRRQAFTCTVQFLLYAVFAMAYAVCAAVLVIWSELRVATPPGVLTPAQLTAAIHVSNNTGAALHTSIAFATFWGATLAAGRVALAIIDRWRSELARLALAMSSRLSCSGCCWPVGVFTHHLGLSTFAVFILAALGCAALLPLTISFSPCWDRPRLKSPAALSSGVIVTTRSPTGIVAAATGRIKPAGQVPWPFSLVRL